MNTRMLTIAGKRRENPIAFVSLNDFEHHDAGATDPRAVLEQPNTSLYCLDHQNKRAIFVVTSPGVNLSEAPFYYQAQYQHAQSLIAVPYETLHELVDDVPVDPERMIFIYSVGRCGSTLVSVPSVRRRASRASRSPMFTRRSLCFTRMVAPRVLT